jgi:cytidylate kinase
MHRDGLDYDEAIAKIQKKDKSREDYYNYYTFGNWGVASTYDLCLDSSVLGIKGTADIILEFIQKSSKADE